VILSLLNECKNFPLPEHYIWVGDGLHQSQLESYVQEKGL